jgi:hypothetical protein
VRQGPRIHDREGDPVLFDGVDLGYQFMFRVALQAYEVVAQGSGAFREPRFDAL